MPLDPIEPTEGLLLIQVPPGVMSDNVVVKPVHTDKVPLIGEGIGSTVTTAVSKHPVGRI